VSLLRRRPAFRRLWTSGAVSETGDWLLLIALPVYVLQLTGSALTTSTVFLLELAGALLASPLAGVLADRWDRRRLLIWASLAQAALLLPLLAVDGPGRLWVVYLVTAAQAVLSTANDPVRQALLPAAVEPAELAGAAAQLGVAANLARLVGGALGGLLLQVYGLPGVVLADAATFVLAALLLTGWSTPRVGRAAEPAGAEQAADGRAGAGREWLAGLAVIRADRQLLGGVAVGSLLSVAQGMFVVLFVVFVLRRLGGEAGEVGLLRGVQAIGGIAGGLVLSVVASRVAPRTLVAAGCFGFGAVCLALWNAPAVSTAPPLYLGLFMIIGVPIAAGLAGLMAVLLGATPDEFRGRVMSTLIVADASAQAVGTLLAGALVGVVGLLPLLEAHAGLGLAAGVVALATLEPAQRPVAEQDPGQDGAGAVGAAVVGDERVVALQPPAVAGRPDRPLDDEQVRAAGEARDDEVAGPDRSPGPDEECVPVPQGRDHRRTDHEDPPDGPAE
jgi:MFS family permease